MTRPVSANALLHGVAEFWNSKAFTDLEVVCGVDGKVVQSHRLVLSALSPVIRHALARYTHSHHSKHPSDVKQNGTQEKESFSGTVFNTFSHGVLRFVVSGSFKNH